MRISAVKRPGHRSRESDRRDALLLWPEGSSFLGSMATVAIDRL
jgi:hypothetical protein